MSLQLRAQNDWYTGVSASLPPPPFSPTSIADLAMWLDASDATTITLDGSNNVEQWRDKSGFARHANQGDAARRPSYPSNVQNSLPGLLFDSTDDDMTGYANAASASTWFLVHRWNGSTRDTRFVSNQAASGVGLGLSASSSNTLSFVREGVAWTTSGFSPGNGTNRIYRVLFSGTTSTYWTWTGGTETQRQTLALGGTVGSPPGFGFPGHHFERILYHRALTTDEINQVYTYLSSKWGIA